jgi:diphosphomevalonate decarboxylase
MNQDDLCTRTSAASSSSFERDRLWLNGSEEDVAASKRINSVLREIRALAKKSPIPGGPNPDHFIHMASYNNFPTAAGLASSAAGYACMGK